MKEKNTNEGKRETCNKREARKQGYRRTLNERIKQSKSDTKSEKKVRKYVRTPANVRLNKSLSARDISCRGLRAFPQSASQLICNTRTLSTQGQPLHFRLGHMNDQEKKETHNGRSMNPPQTRMQREFLNASQHTAGLSVPGAIKPSADSITCNLLPDSGLQRRE